MPDPLELTVQSFTADQLAIKVKNISSAVLDRSLVIELFVPSFLLNSKVKDASKAAATNKKPKGVATLSGVVTGGPDGWSVWAKRETSEASIIIALFNDLSQTGIDLATPVKVAAGAEFVIRIPLNPQANRESVHIIYNYQHGTDEKNDKPVRGKLELKSTDTGEWSPVVVLNTNHPTPTMIPPGSPVKVMWQIKDGVSAILRGPLSGGNSELPLSPKPEDDFKIAEGYVEVLVIGGMTYILQAEVKRQGHPNVQVVRMLTLDTSNNKYCFIAPHPPKVLPYGLIEIDWAAWGMKEVTISVSGHTTRSIELTQQTLGRFYEGSGIMRVIATKEINKERTKEERITIEGTSGESMTKPVEVRSWIPLEKPKIQGDVQGMAVIAPTMAVLTTQGLYIADVKMEDQTPFQTKLLFTQVAIPIASVMWLALTAASHRFLCLRMLANNGNIEILPFTPYGAADAIPPVTLPSDATLVAAAPGAVIDFVGVGKRAYFAAESPRPLGVARIAYSIGFNTTTEKADIRREPILEFLQGYRLVAFDDALYALHRKSGRMFRFDILASGQLDKPKKAATAVKKDQSMVADGLLVPVGRVLLVMNPTAVPSVETLEAYGLKNTLSYTGSTTLPDDLPQDLVYNPLRDYWARCGHDIDVKDACAAYRGGDSKRLWVIRDSEDLQTLTVSSESLFAHDYVRDFPTKALPPYLNKKRQFKITNNTGINFVPLSPKLVTVGLRDFNPAGFAELTEDLPQQRFRSGTTETIEFAYSDADPSPIKVTFEIEIAAGVKHDYVLEVTFSGPDLSTATSVFKRIAKSVSGMWSIAEIPGTTLQHATNNPIVITPPKPMIENVSLRAQNGTTYQLLKEVPQSDDRYERIGRYNGETININFNTPTVYLSAFGAGQLDINVDFSLPVGIEISSGKQAQTKLIRIDTDKSRGLKPELLPSNTEKSYEFKVAYLLKQELNYVYIGDGMATVNGDTIYLPVANAQGQALLQVLKIDPEKLAVKGSTLVQSTGVFSTPNSVVVGSNYVLAMFGDTDIYVYNYSLEQLGKVNIGDTHAVVTGIAAAYTNEFIWLGQRKDKTPSNNISFHYSVANKLIAPATNKFVTDNTREVSVDAVKGFNSQNKMANFPTWVSSKTTSPMAVSPMSVAPNGDRVREVAVCVDGGIFVVGKADKPAREIAVSSAGQEEAIAFGREGKTIYCLHSQDANQGLRLSRIDNVASKQTAGLTLPRGEGVADLTTDTRQRQPGTAYKIQRSASMVIDLDEKLIFVSHGKSIFKIDAATMKVVQTFQMELPCRVFQVWWGKPTQDSHPDYGTPTSCTLLYAIGASYRGNGYDGREFKTQLYKLAIPNK